VSVHGSDLQAVERWHRSSDLDRRVAALDPVGLDDWLAAIAGMNAGADVAGLLDLLRQITEAAPEPRRSRCLRALP